MSAKKTAAKPAKDDGAGVTAKPEILRVKVLKQGLQTKAGTAARGLVMPMTKADAELFEKRGDVAILGVA